MKARRRCELTSYSSLAMVVVCEVGGWIKEGRISAGVAAETAITRSCVLFQWSAQQCVGEQQQQGVEHKRRVDVVERRSAVV